LNRLACLLRKAVKTVNACAKVLIGLSVLIVLALRFSKGGVTAAILNAEKSTHIFGHGNLIAIKT
jgi:hypothetical protein